MVGMRHFDGGRGGGRVGAASELMRLEMQKKGKLPAAQRYKRIMQKKMEENKKAALGSAYKKPFSLSGKIGGIPKMSARAEQALKEISMKKARKLARAERQMVIVQPRNFSNGRITKKGDIYDVAGNVVAKVNTKNGRITSMTGWGVGKYKPKSMFTDMVIMDTINKYSPYFINLRKMQQMQMQGNVDFGVHGNMGAQDVISVHGAIPNPHNVNTPYGMLSQEDADILAKHGFDNHGPRQNIGVTAWGARSDNVWGSYTDNAWGTSTDNVWGGNSTDVWGGMGAGNLWGSYSPRVFGTGNNKNYIKAITGFFASLFGFTNKKNRETLRQLTALANAYRNSSNAARGGSSGSSATMRTPTTTRTR